MEELSGENLDILATNLSRIRARIAESAEKVSRNPDDILLVAVTKYQPAEVIPALLELGVKAIGESRPEIALKKRDSLEDHVPWHMIGHYQRKKISKTLGIFQNIHSVHSLELLSSLDHEAGKLSETKKPLNVMIQVNVANEAQKQGFAPKDVEDVCHLAQAFSRLNLTGLMTMAPRSAKIETSRDVFRGLADLRREIGAEIVPHLSMGMSQDFEVAIEEGATILRIGSVLFDGLTFDH